MARKIIFLASAAFALGMSSSAMAAPDDTVIVGILEEHPSDTNAKPVFVRAVFHKTGAAWAAYDPACAKGACFPRETNWTVGFDGRAVGQVRAVTPAAWEMISDVGRQSLAPGARAPFVGERSEKFTGWAGGPVHRPLVSTSSTHVADPEGWKAAALPAPLDKAVRDRMRAKFPKAERCASAEENTPAPWAYQDGDLVVDGGYASKSGWRIARVSLKADDYRCDGPLPDTGESPFSAMSVAISPAGAMTELGFDMQLLDAGDYDANGRSELVFMFSHYNADGYKLFANDFSEQASFGFSFH